MPIIIEKDIPYTPRRRSSELVDTMRMMEVDDSFLFQEAERNRVPSTARRLRPKKFSARKDGDGYVRVWRIE